MDKNQLARVSAGAADVKSTPAQGSAAPSLMATIVNSVTAPFSNGDPSDFTEMKNSEIAQNLMDNFADALTSSGDLVSLSSNAVQINQTARDMIFQPKRIEMQVSQTQAAYKTQVSPVLLTFDGSSVLPSGNTQAQWGGDIPPVPVYAAALRITARDILNGTSQVNIVTRAGVDIQVKLKDVTKEAWVVILNHSEDVTTNVNGTLTPSVPPIPDVLAFAATSTAATDQFVFDDKNAPKWTFSGTNANVDIYPVVPRREVMALIEGLYYSDRINELAHMLQIGFSREVN